MRVLASCFSAVHVPRPDTTTLAVRPEKGFLDNEWLRMVRGLSRPFRPGDEVVLSDLRARVRDVTADGRPPWASVSGFRPCPRGRPPPPDPDLRRSWRSARRG
jgi:hypothetical protein